MCQGLTFNNIPLPLKNQYCFVSPSKYCNAGLNPLLKFTFSPNNFSLEATLKYSNQMHAPYQGGLNWYITPPNKITVFGSPQVFLMWYNQISYNYKLFENGFLYDQFLWLDHLERAAKCWLEHFLWLNKIRRDLLVSWDTFW